MGVFFTAYRDIELVVNPRIVYDELADPVTGEWQENHFKVLTFAAFPSAAPELTHGDYYIAPETSRSDTISYSYYHAWRGKLVDMVGDETDPSFTELIRFSDCEGTLGPRTCIKLSRDFQRWDAFVRQSSGSDQEHFYRVYLQLKDLFAFAGNCGAVVLR